MECPDCKGLKHQVLETRTQTDGSIKRRRKCMQCNGRFVTLESIVNSYPSIIKKNGELEIFSKNKLKRGIQLACQKRPVSLSQIEHIVEKITDEIKKLQDKDISSLWLGKTVMEELKKCDDVAFVRFASVYRSFNDIKEFVDGLDLESVYTHKTKKNEKESLPL